MATSNATPEEDPDDFTDPAQAAIAKAIDRLTENEKVLAAAQAEKNQILANIDLLGRKTFIRDRLRGNPAETGWNSSPWDDEELGRRTMAAEVAFALRLNRNTAGIMVFEATRLVGQLPLFQKALSEGTISWAHARKMLEVSENVPTEVLPAFERQVLPAAEKCTVSRFGQVAVRARERLHPVPLEERATLSQKDRRVWVEPDLNGMAWMKAYMKVDDAQAVFDRLTQMATNLDESDLPEDERRTMDQRRADAYRDLLVDGVGPDGLGQGIRGTVSITVPVLTLLGKSNEPAILNGHSPVDAETARKIAGAARSFTRILVHPETGCTLSVGRESYSPPAELKKYTEVRDGTCRAPGCNRQATNSDLDHTQPWSDGGTTSADNLVHLCSPCHRLKHQSSFTTSQKPNGDLVWTSPSGKEYLTEPASYIGELPPPVEDIAVDPPGAPEAPAEVPPPPQNDDPPPF